MTEDDRSTPPAHGIRELTDARSMRALAHPVRMELLEMLRLEGPLTATEAGERIGESPTTCSFHLRQLARYGFVEEAGGGKGRARPWRLIPGGLRFSTDQDSPEAGLAADTLARLYRDRQFARLSAWYESRASYPREWREAASSGAFSHWLTAEELAELDAEIIELLAERFPERVQDPAARPEGARPVELIFFSYPMNAPEGGL